MNLLLDTHILLWALTDNENLSYKARDLLINPDNEIFYSDISLWEIAIKHQKRPSEFNFDEKIVDYYCQESYFIELPLKKRDIFLLSELNRKSGQKPHNDPFDRLLICQAISEELMLLTHDSLIPGYDADCIISV